VSRPLQRGGRPGVIWVAPALVYFVFFAIVPMAIVVALSFTKWSGIGSPTFSGLSDWKMLGTDPQLGQSLWLTISLTVISWLLQTAICLPLGIWLAGHSRTRGVLGAIFFVPLLMSSAAISILWGGLLDPNFGLASVIGPFVGVGDGNFIGNPQLALWVVVAVIAWQFVPFHVLLYQGATRQIPLPLYEAARIDGAGRFRQFVSVTVPQLRNMIITSSVLMIVGSLTYFDVVLILTNGGPGTATRILPLHMYLEGFQSFDMGYASVLAVLLLAFGTALSLVISRVTGFSRMDSQKDGI